MRETPASPSSQFALLRQQRFGPFFATQFLGAANDNLFKFALTVLVTYQLQVAWLPASVAGLVIGALFILPFVLLSATAGQLADRMDKALLMRRVKDCEIAIMAVAVLGFLMQWPATLLLCLVAMGVHSTFFGPAKFAYLPQVLRRSELTGGNGMVEMGTFVAILLGNMLGGWLMALPQGRVAVALTCLLCALVGRVAVHYVPQQEAVAPASPMRWNPWTETRANLRLARQDGVTFRALLGISWMWFFGAVFLAEFPVLAKDVLQGDAQVAALLLMVFSIGVGCGALGCEHLSRQRVEPGLVPLGALGMTLFAVDLWWTLQGLPAAGEGLQGVKDFVQAPQRWRVLLDLLGLSMAAGIYSVPLYALMQQRSPASHRARIVAANNILNALFMVVSALLAGGLLAAGLDVPELFLSMGVANALFVAVMCWRDRQYLRRSKYWLQRRWRA